MNQTKQVVQLENYIAEYQLTGNQQIRNLIVEQSLNLVKIISAKTMQGYHATYDKDDIINEGIIGLMDAIERFDSAAGVKFETYASIRVRGAIIDFLRRQDDVPRRLVKLNKDIDHAKSELYTKLNRPCDKQELMEHLQISDKEYDDAKRSAAKMNSVSLESLLWDDGIQFELDSGQGNQNEERLEDKELLVKLVTDIKLLSEREQLILSLYYVDQIKFKDIGELLGISQSRVWQIHAESLKKLKLRLTGYV